MGNGLRKKISNVSFGLMRINIFFLNACFTPVKHAIFLDSSFAHLGVTDTEKSIFIFSSCVLNQDFKDYMKTEKVLI